MIITEISFNYNIDFENLFLSIKNNGNSDFFFKFASKTAWIYNHYSL